MSSRTILIKYNEFKKQVKQGFYSSEITKILDEIYFKCLEFLDKVKRVQLVSKVENKEYFAFTNGKKIRFYVVLCGYHYYTCLGSCIFETSFRDGKMRR